MKQMSLFNIRTQRSFNFKENLTKDYQVDLVGNFHISNSYFAIPSEWLKTKSIDFVVLESILICK